MGNPRSFTTLFNVKRDELEAFVKLKAGRSRIKRLMAMERAATMPNSRPPLLSSRSIERQGK